MARLDLLLSLAAAILMSFSSGMPTKPSHTRLDARSATKTRLRRQAVETDVENEAEYFRRVGGGNITGISYMLQLYKQLTNENVKAYSSSNIIKSMNYDPTSNNNCSCNEFQFGMVNLNSHELFHQAKLRLFLQTKVPQKTATYTAIIQVKNPPSGYTPPAVTQNISANEEGYKEFNMTRMFKPLIGKGHAVIFVVSVFHNDSSILNCRPDDEIIFANSPLDEDKIPILTVHSYLKIEMQVNDTMELIQQQVEVQRREPNRHQRRKRFSANRHVCTVLDFVIPTTYIPPAAFSGYLKFRPILPATYNSGICGGLCSLSFPHASSTPYAILLHGLIRQDAFPDHNYNFAQSCVPVEFDPVHVLGISEGTVAVVSIDDMIVRTCSCADFAI